MSESSGEVYVADAGGNRVERFDGGGGFQAAFGASGSGDGELGFNGLAAQVAVDQADGSVYVADPGNDRVQKFTAAGVYVTQFGGSGAGDGQMSGPQGVAVDPTTGDVLVADTNNGRVQRFDSGGGYLSQFGTAGSGFGQLLFPSRVAIDSTGRVFVLDAGNGRIEVFSPSGAFGAVFAPGLLSFPGDLAVDQADDHVYVVAPDPILGVNAVLELDPAGNTVDSHAADAGFLATGLGVRSGGGRVYLGEGLSSRVLILDAVTPPDATIAAVGDVDADSATLHGQVNPQGTSTGYYFEYSLDGATWLPAPADSGGAPLPVDVGAGTSAVAVAQAVDGLAPNTEYRVRLVAVKPFNAGTTTSDEATFTTDPLAPAVQTFSADRSATGARLAGSVNPRNSSTTYYFEYGTDSTYGQSVPTSQDADAGAGGVAVAVTQQVGGLAPQTTYHYRLVAQNQAGTTEGGDRTLTTSATSASSPPTRVYEKVSPDDKGGFDATARFRHAAAVDGNRVTFNLGGVGPGAEQGGALSTYVATRGSNAGWDAGRPIDPLTRPIFGIVPLFGNFSADLSQSVVQAYSKLTPDASDNTTQLFKRDTVSGAYQLLTPQPIPPNEAGHPNVQGLSAGAVTTPDYSHLVYESGAGVAQTGDPITGTINPYEWIDGQVRLVGVLPGGSAAPNGSLPGSGHNGKTRHAISADGSRVFFHATTDAQAVSPDSSTDGQLYAREDGATTTHVSGSQRSAPDPAGPLPAFFWDAEAAHGDKVIFTSCEKLTDAATASVDPSQVDGLGLPLCESGSTFGEQQLMRGRDLYRYDVPSGELSDLTTADTDGADVFGVVGSSEDLERIYFVAGGVLAPGATKGEPNLYLWDGGTTRFLATLGQSCAGVTASQITDCLNWTEAGEAARDRVSRVSPDGRFLVVTSRAALTGGDNANSACSEGRCTEVFRYDALRDELTCTSCAAGPPQGDARLTRGQPGITSDFDEAARNLAADGSYVFFETPAALVADDSNGAYDVYRWSQDRVSLVSSGRGGSDAFFVDASADGKDVFFLTRDKLNASDRDELVDLYDARIGGRPFEPLPPSRPCIDDECQGPPTSAPDRMRPGTTTSPEGQNANGRRGVFVLGKIGKRQRARCARTGTLTLSVRVNVAGKVSASMRATIGGRSRLVARASTRASRAGSVKLRLRLSQTARRQLSSRGRLKLSILASFSKTPERRSLSLSLRKAGA